jgi:hypothetical protein
MEQSIVFARSATLTSAKHHQPKQNNKKHTESRFVAYNAATGVLRWQPQDYKRNIIRQLFRV